MDAAELDRLERLQALFIRLLFCARTLDEYGRDRDGVLATYGLAPADAADLPDPASANFRAEVRGRRGIVRHEIAHRFPKTVALLARRGDGAGRIDFDEFLGSDHFLDPALSLPHPYGVGPGYESISKYFFWLRDVSGSARPGADIELRTAMNCEFAMYLMDLIRRPCHEFYRRFTGGVFWPQTPGEALPVHLVTDQGRLFTLSDPAKVAQLPRIGLQDLDTVAPVDWALEPSIG